MADALFLQFALTNDAAAATSSKLNKTAILATYFRSLDPEDLRRAVRCAAGWAFGAGGVLNVGYAAVRPAVLELWDVEAGELHQQVVRSGELGEALAALWNRRREAGDAEAAPLRLADIDDAFDELSRTGAQQRKREVLRVLLARAGHPREAAYLCKVIFHELRTGVQQGVLQGAVAQAFGHTLAEIQRAQLLVGDLGQIAVLAQRHELHLARFELFHPIQFMLATPQETPERAEKTMAGRMFFAEPKLDGIRAQVHKAGDRVEIYTRTMGRADAAFADVVEEMRKAPGEFLLDGEIVPYEAGQVLPFAHIQRRLGRKVPTPKIIRENPAAFVAFDLLYLDGRLLMDEPLRVRRQVMERWCAAPGQEAPDPAGGAGAASAQPGLLTTKATVVSSAVEVAAAFAAARESRNEGIVLKDPESAYAPGRRGQAWLKLKTHLPTLDCVVTAAERGHGKRREWLSDYTFAVWDGRPQDPGSRLVNIGKAYSGVSDAEIRQLTELLQSLTIEQRGGYHAVRPQLVLEIACDQIQKSNRHVSGFALRFPRIKRIRWDKGIDDADRLERVAEIYHSAANTARQTRPSSPPAPRADVV